MQGLELERRVGAAAIRRKLGRGTSLFRQGDRTFGIFLVIDGQVRLLRHGFDGNVVTLHVARPQETFAEASLFSDTYHCEAVADRPSTVSFLPKAAVLALLDQDKEFALGFAGRLARQVQILRAQVELKNIRSAEERVLAALSLRMPSGDAAVEIAGPLTAFASEIGLTHEALYRALRRLEERGAIERSGKLFRLMSR